MHARTQTHRVDPQGAHVRAWHLANVCECVSLRARVRACVCACVRRCGHVCGCGWGRDSLGNCHIGAPGALALSATLPQCKNLRELQCVTQPLCSSASRHTYTAHHITHMLICLFMAKLHKYTLPRPNDHTRTGRKLMCLSFTHTHSLSLLLSLSLSCVHARLDGNKLGPGGVRALTTVLALCPSLAKLRYLMARPVHL
jgi:hypothetical protein